MSYQNSVAIIRTRKDSVVGCHMIFTNRYVAANRHQFVYRGYPCSEFHIAETEGGDVIVTTFDVMPQSKVIIREKPFSEAQSIPLYETPYPSSYLSGI